MENFLEEILGWKNILENSKKINYDIKTLENYFNSIEHYKNSYESLCFEELRAQFDRLLEINLNKEKILLGKIINKETKCKKFLINVFLKRGWVQNSSGKRLSLVIKKNLKKKIMVQKYFGVINETKPTNKGIISIEVGFSNWKNNFQPDELIQVILFKQTSGFVELLKEFNVLNSIENIGLRLRNAILSSQIILANKKKKKINFTSKFHLLTHFNKSQLEAIVSFLDNDITLIQGPPGTGKTRTILGIISLVNFTRKEIDCRFLSHSIEEKVLICAPSNAAIDENVMRATEGFILISKFKKKWPIKIVRLGPNYHSVIDHISLENLAIIISSDIDQQIRLSVFNKIFRKIRNKIVKKAPIIFTTLACTGYSIMKMRKKVETVIIDEAGQAIELTTLIPIKDKCKKMILIGDVQQLPATVFSKFSADFGYNRSLFKRFQIDSFSIKFLENQFRMHPQISSFPARKFYRNCLKDSSTVFEYKKIQTLRCFGPLILFDVSEGQEQSHLGKSSSWCNLDELRVLRLLLRSLICLYPNFNTNSFGIIGGYNGQIDEIKNYKLTERQENEIQVNTIDGFQGREKDIIIFTCVRAKIEPGVGFLADCRRVNVGFTRAKNGFWVIGDLNFLKSSKNWSELIKDAKKRIRTMAIRKPFERSIRKMIYWSPLDNIDFSDDGNGDCRFYHKLLNYLNMLKN